MTYILATGDESVQGSEAWLKFRKGKIGASDAPAIAGISPWETRLQCWERFVLDKKKETTPAMMRGHKYEERARQLYCEIFEDSFHPIVAVMGDNESLMASLDGWNGKKILEIKCPNKETHLMARRGVIPDYYKCQMQHQMMVMGCDEADYCSYDHFTDELAVVSLERDEKFIKDLLSLEKAFIQSLIDFKPPEACSRDWVEETDPERIEMAKKLRQMTLDMKDAQMEIDELKKRLIEGNKTSRVSFGEIKMQKVVAKGRIDYESLIERYGIKDVESYRKPSMESWRVLT